MLKHVFLIIMFMGTEPGTETNVMYEQIDCTHPDTHQVCTNLYLQYVQLADMLHGSEDSRVNESWIGFVNLNPGAVPFSYRNIDGEVFDTLADSQENKQLDCMMCHNPVEYHDRLIDIIRIADTHFEDFNDQQCSRCHVNKPEIPKEIED